MKPFCFAITLMFALPSMGNAETNPNLNIETQISGGSGLFISTRYMRHVVLNTQNPQSLTKPVVVVQQSGLHDKTLEVYANNGDWTSHGSVIPVPVDSQGAPTAYSYNQRLLISDSVMDGDDILVVYSALRDGDIIDANTGLIKASYPEVGLTRMEYSALADNWESVPLASLTLAPNLAASRATVTVDALGRYWCAVRIFEEGKLPEEGLYYIKTFVSEDKGQSWQAVNGRFGSVNGLPNKNPRIFAQSAGIGMVYHDVYINDTSNKEIRQKVLVFRGNHGPLLNKWNPKKVIIGSYTASNDSYGSHWSMVSDKDENIHIAYQNADKGIQYVKLTRGNNNITITDDVLLSSDPTWIGAYPALSASKDDSEVALVMAEERPDGNSGYEKRIVWTKINNRNIDDLTWHLISDNRTSRLRMISPETYSVNDGFTMFYEVSGAEVGNEGSGNYQLFVNNLLEE